MPIIEEEIKEGQLLFNFPIGALSSKYDDWPHYQNQFKDDFLGNKAVDIVYCDDETAWLIEIKDYRVHERTKTIDLADEVAIKVRDTLAGLVSSFSKANDADERRVAGALLKKKKWRVVLHLEVPKVKSRLRRDLIEPDKIKHKLRSLVKAIDPHPSVVNQNTLQTAMKWTVTDYKKT